MRYVILAKGGHEGFSKPRQLSVINGERLLDRTIRLLRENGIKDIIVTGNYTDIDAKVIDPEENTYSYTTNKGYWLDAFNGFLDKPTCFIWGDVYFSEAAIKTIVETKGDMFFCSYQNKDKRYIKKWDEPFSYKVENIELFKEHIERVKHLYDIGYADRNPIIWEVYRSIKGIDINEHKIKDGITIINDITCDIDTPLDVEKIKFKLGVGEMVRVKARIDFSYSKFDEIKELVRANAEGNEKGYIKPNDMFLVSNEQAEYLTETAEWVKQNHTPLVDIIEVIPEGKKVEPKKAPVKKAVKKTTKK
jgi:choline kinase